MGWLGKIRLPEATLYNKHTIAVRVKAIFLGYGVAVRFQRQFLARESAYQNQKTGLGQMEIGEHRPGPAEAESWRDEEIGFTGRRTAFDCPDDGSAHGHHSPGMIHGFNGFGRNHESLLMEVDVLERLRPEGLKSSEPYMKRDIGNPRPSGSAGFQDFGREVQARSGRRRGSRLAREDRLVAFAVGGCVGAANIGRQGHVTYAIEHSKQIANRMQPDNALAECAAAKNFGGKIVGNMHALARAHFLARMNQSFPGEPVGGERSRQQNLNPARAVFAAAVEARWKHAGIIENQAVASGEIAGEIPEPAVFPLSGGAIDHQHPRSGAFGEGFLGDEFFRKMVVEIGNEHV